MSEFDKFGMCGCHLTQAGMCGCHLTQASAAVVRLEEISDDFQNGE